MADEINMDASKCDVGFYVAGNLVYVGDYLFSCTFSVYNKGMVIFWSMLETVKLILQDFVKLHCLGTYFGGRHC